MVVRSIPLESGLEISSLVYDGGGPGLCPVPAKPFRCGGFPFLGISDWRAMKAARKRERAGKSKRESGGRQQDAGLSMLFLECP